MPEHILRYDRTLPFPFCPLPPLGPEPPRIDSRRAAIPALELTAALVLGSLYASSLARVGTPQGSGFCDNINGESESCHKFNRVFMGSIAIQCVHASCLGLR